MSKQAENWAWNQTWCDSTDKLVLIAMCRLARGATYSGGTHQIARLAGVTSQTVKRAIRKFREVSLMTSPKRGTWIFDISSEVSPVTPQIEPEQRKDFLSPITPFLSKENFIVLPRAHEEESKKPEWVSVINSTAKFCGGSSLTSRHIKNIEDKYKFTDLVEEALAFESHHRSVHQKKPYKTFATYLRFSTTWLRNTKEKRNGFNGNGVSQTNTDNAATRPIGAPSPLL